MRDSIVEPGRKLLSMAVGMAVAVIGLLVAVHLFSGVNYLLVLALLALGAYEIVKRRKPGGGQNHWFLAAGLLSLLAAAVCLLNMADTLLVWDAVLFTIPIWAITNGLCKLASALHTFHDRGIGWGYLVFTGGFAVLMGAVLILFPLAGILTMSEFTGILIGILLLIYGINVMADAYA